MPDAELVSGRDVTAPASKRSNDVLKTCDLPFAMTVERQTNLPFDIHLCKMCITKMEDTPTPVATNFGLGQCAGSGTSELRGRAPRRAMLPASVGVTDGHHGFDVLFGEGDDIPSEDMQLVLQEMICNPEAKSEAAEHVKEST
ncbi:hypothetical protein B0T16DRAFT_392639 [Cercophora newfieldiana]|uniref:Uncharacterized protein n=1 Tax=Cercophora newfieldiana TaxID=92897 RepID=A0AA40CNW9_9PEZI|nr:hypothetical protein B0T16DRAFT_392639 [Cercophora newfieldiana]